MARRHRAQAFAWIVRLKTKPSETPLWPAFRRWREQCPENRQAFEEIEDLWHIWVRQNPRNGLGQPSGQAPSSIPFWVAPLGRQLPADIPRQKRRTPILMAISVAWLSIVPSFRPVTVETAGAWVNTGWSRSETLPSEASRTLTLSDRSKVELGPDTVVEYQLNADYREFVLKRGRAIFIVNTDGRPFEVKAGGVAVLTDGTTFSVGHGSRGEIVTVVQRGKVAVIPRTASGIRVLNGGEAARIDGQVRMLSHLIFSKGQQVVFDFDQTPLSQAIDAFNYYNKRQLEITDPRITQEPIWGQFAADDPDGFARALSAMRIAGVAVNSDQNSSIIRSQRPLHR